MNTREMSARFGSLQEPSPEDVWQAASLLVGIYGDQAIGYAVTRRERYHAKGDRTGVATWEMIVSQIKGLIGGSPKFAQ